MMSSNQWDGIVEVGGDGEDEYWVFDNAVSTTAMSRLEDFPTSQHLVRDSSFRDESVFSYSSWLLTTEMDELFAEEQHVSDLMKGSSGSTMGTESDTNESFQVLKEQNLQGTEVVLADATLDCLGKDRAEARDDTIARNVMLYTRRKKKQKLSSNNEAPKPISSSSEEGQSSSDSSSSVLTQDSGSILLTRPTVGGIRGRLRLPRRRPRRANKMQLRTSLLSPSESGEETMSPSPLAPEKVPKSKSDDDEIQSAAMPLLKSPAFQSTKAETVGSIDAFGSYPRKDATIMDYGFGKSIRPILKKASQPIKTIPREETTTSVNEKTLSSIQQKPKSTQRTPLCEAGRSGIVETAQMNNRERSIQSLVTKIVDGTNASENDTTYGVLSPRSECSIRLTHLAFVSVSSSASEGIQEMNKINDSIGQSIPDDEKGKEENEKDDSFSFDPNDPVLLGVRRILREESHGKMSVKYTPQQGIWPEYDPGNPVLLDVKRELQSNIRSYLGTKSSKENGVAHNLEDAAVLASVESLLRKSKNRKTQVTSGDNYGVQLPAKKQERVKSSRGRSRIETCDMGRPQNHTFVADGTSCQRSHTTQKESFFQKAADESDNEEKGYGHVAHTASRSPEGDYLDIKNLLEKEEGEAYGEEDGLKLNHVHKNATELTFEPLGAATEQGKRTDDSSNSFANEEASIQKPLNLITKEAGLLIKLSDPESASPSNSISTKTVNLFGLPFVTFPEHAGVNNSKSDDSKGNSCAVATSQDSPYLKNSTELDTPYKLSCDSQGEDMIQKLRLERKGDDMPHSGPISNTEEINFHFEAQSQSHSGSASHTGKHGVNEGSIDKKSTTSLLDDGEQQDESEPHPVSSSEANTETKAPFIRVNVSSLSDGHPLDTYYESFKNSIRTKDVKEDWCAFPSSSKAETVSLPRKTSIKEGPSRENLHVHFATSSKPPTSTTEYPPLSFFQSRQDLQKSKSERRREAPLFGFNVAQSTAERCKSENDRLPECEPFPVDFSGMEEDSPMPECDPFPVDFAKLDDSKNRLAEEKMLPMTLSNHLERQNGHKIESTRCSNDNSFQHLKSTLVDTDIPEREAKTRSCRLNRVFQKAFKAVKSHSKALQCHLRRRRQARYRGVSGESELNENLGSLEKISGIHIVGEYEQASKLDKELAPTLKIDRQQSGEEKQARITSTGSLKVDGAISRRSFDESNIPSFHKDNIIADSSSSRSKASTDRLSHSLPLSVQSEDSFCSSNESNSGPQRKLSKDSSAEWLNESKSKLSKPSMRASGLISKTKKVIENINSLRRQTHLESVETSTKHSLDWKRLKDLDESPIISTGENSSPGTLRKFFLRTTVALNGGTFANYGEVADGSIADTDVVSAWSFEK